MTVVSWILSFPTPARKRSSNCPRTQWSSYFRAAIVNRIANLRASPGRNLARHKPGGSVCRQFAISFINMSSSTMSKARSNRTALETFRERVGVCRDFTHLAITLCRCLNIPARYVNGYLGDIGVPPAPYPMDFSAWMEVYLSGRWFSFDPRHNCRRIGRTVIARGRDACDVPLTISFGKHTLEAFSVVTEEVSEDIGCRKLTERRPEP